MCRIFKNNQKCVRCKSPFHKLNTNETDCINAGCKTGQYYSNIKKMCMYNCKDGQYFDDRIGWGVCKYCGPGYIPAGNECKACPKGHMANLGDNECRPYQNVGDRCYNNSECRSNLCSESIFDWYRLLSGKMSINTKKYCW